MIPGEDAGSSSQTTGSGVRPKAQWEPPEDRWHPTMCRDWQNPESEVAQVGVTPGLVFRVSGAPRELPNRWFKFPCELASRKSLKSS